MLNKFMAFGIKVNDFDKAYEFYTKILGLETKTIDKKTNLQKLN